MGDNNVNVPDPYLATSPLPHGVDPAVP